MNMPKNFLSTALACAALCACGKTQFQSASSDTSASQGGAGQGQSGKPGTANEGDANKPGTGGSTGVGSGSGNGTGSGTTPGNGSGTTPGNGSGTGNGTGTGIGGKGDTGTVGAGTGKPGSGTPGGNVTPGGKGEDNPHPTPPPVPEGKTLLQLEIKQLPTNPWYKNCLTVSVNGESKSIGCNKDSNSVGRWVYFLADKAPACNKVKVKIETYFNIGDACAQRHRQGLDCNGPYAAAPDQVRETTVSAAREFYRVYDYVSVGSPDPLIHSSTQFGSLKGEMAAYAAGGKNSWLRVFFEDLSPEQLAQGKRDPAGSDKVGINFADYIFDIKGQDVRIAVDGFGTCR